VLITGLIAAFTANVTDHPAISAETKQEVGIRVEGDVSFVDSDQVAAAAAEAGLEGAEAEAVVEGYEDAQLNALKLALLFAGLTVLASFAGTRHLPNRRFDELGAAAEAPAAA
jgi:hypothetical protein